MSRCTMKCQKDWPGVVGRLKPYYGEVVAWVAPGLTHRSFILDREHRSANGVAASRRSRRGDLASLWGERFAGARRADRMFADRRAM